MMPSITACDLGDWRVPDHGEAWRSAWTETDAGLTFTSPRGYSLTRKIVAGRTEVTLTYTVVSTVMRAFLWAAHPLVSTPPGSWVDVGDWRGEVLVQTRLGTTTELLSRHLLSPATLAPGSFRKIVFPSDRRCTAARVVHPDDAWIAMTWTAETVPYTAIYLENRAFTPTACVAIEPMTGWYDSLADASANGLVSVARPDVPYRWSITLTSGLSDAGQLVTRHGKESHPRRPADKHSEAAQPWARGESELHGGS